MNETNNCCSVMFRFPLARKGNVGNVWEIFSWARKHVMKHFEDHFWWGSEVFLVAPLVSASSEHDAKQELQIGHSQWTLSLICWGVHELWRPCSCWARKAGMHESSSKLKFHYKHFTCHTEGYDDWDGAFISSGPMLPPTEVEMKVWQRSTGSSLIEGQKIFSLSHDHNSRKLVVTGEE